jgi:hypothetical protein
MNEVFDIVVDSVPIGQPDTGDTRKTGHTRGMGRRASVGRMPAAQAYSENIGNNGPVEIALSRLEPDGGELHVAVGGLRLRVSVKNRHVVAIEPIDDVIAEELSGRSRRTGKTATVLNGDRISGTGKMAVLRMRKPPRRSTA